MIGAQTRNRLAQRRQLVAHRTQARPHHVEILQLLAQRRVLALELGVESLVGGERDAVGVDGTDGGVVLADCEGGGAGRRGARGGSSGCPADAGYEDERARAAGSERFEAVAEDLRIRHADCLVLRFQLRGEHEALRRIRP